ncbi:MAG TPA: ABC transporter permease [Stackebrandtia sp.]|jgi:peptide/nickel transport system permease protein|uniref:ABC transporter permease n=1 Tax=Stackebrandtia sp. TaxID=2023065 RepID=UPI002D427869|nr:ABC transporter permease [Stackebrandtia sp.]HZE41001.1 ABC transporter permease [Stackebrandtia sp.]
MSDDLALVAPTGVRERGQASLVLRRFAQHKLAMGSLVVFLLIVAFAFVGPLVWKYDYHLYREIPSMEPPSLAHPFGTDRAGHDVLGQVMRGAQQSLKVAFTVAILATGIGSIWGAVAGFYRGWIDAIMMRLVDVLFVIPFLAVAAAIAGGVSGGVGWFQIALILGLLGWIGTARLVRGQVLSVREQEFIEAARAVGSSDVRIILRHLVPNTTGVILVAATLEMATAILAEAGLSFVGLGIQSPDTSLGLLINSATGAAFTHPWLFYFPGLFIIGICLTVNFIGDGLRDALDPRQTVRL